MGKNYTNPIIPGNYPDPSVCRVNDDYFLINSSFALFPGIPVFHSRDLVNWRQIGHVLDRSSQLHLTADSLFGGIMAPTLRFHDGVFYVICTNMCVGKSFICTAQNPTEPWSEPHWLTDVPGIDPSLFFDEDGRAYITGLDSEEYAGGSRQVIWVSELDLKAMRLTGERPVIWHGALRNARYPEGPHMYRRGGWYYLLSAEGGTEHYHSVVVGRSREIFAEFENYNGNPVLTHRHFGRSYPFSNMGHADLIELPDGRWYAVLLGSRLVNGVGTPLGQETFLVPVAWEDDWPVFSPGTGKAERQYPLPFEPVENTSGKTKAVEFSVRDDFTFGTLPLHWAAYGTPYTGFYD